MTENEAIGTLCELIAKAFDSGVLRRLVLSRQREGEAREIHKLSARLCQHGERRLLSMELSLPGNTVAQRNLTREDLEGELPGLLRGFRQTNLLTGVGDVEMKLARDGRAVLLGADKLSRRLAQGTPATVPLPTLDREKRHLLRGDEDFLILLGISDKNGRVHDKRQSKFRQIDRFLSYMEEVLPALPGEGELTVFDLCCGKSYLSFAVYYYLTVRQGRQVQMYGVDLKADVIAFCADAAARLGYGGMHFTVGDIRTELPDRVPDLVISLHACDTATDVVLDTAIARGARVILSTPCCHRHLAEHLHAPALGFVSAYPYLLHKLGEPLTDALRLTRLAAAGYRVSATELVDPENTPKNTLLRAIYTGRPDPAAALRYRAALTFLYGEDTQQESRTL